MLQLCSRQFPPLGIASSARHKDVISKHLMVMCGYGCVLGVRLGDDAFSGPVDLRNRAAPAGAGRAATGPFGRCPRPLRLLAAGIGIRAGHTYAALADGGRILLAALGIGSPPAGPAMGCGVLDAVCACLVGSHVTVAAANLTFGVAFPGLLSAAGP